MMIPSGLTADELEAGAKGYWKKFPDSSYVDYDDVPVLLSPAHYARLVDWCEPFIAQRYEVQGAVVFHYDDDAGPTEVRIDRVYVMGGNSVSRRTTCELDPEDMLRQMQADYPEMTQFMSNQVGWWHLHPGYFAGLSVGDVEECRQTLRDALALDTRVLHLLMYGDGHGYQLSAYAIGLGDVARFPVRILEP